MISGIRDLAKIPFTSDPVCYRIKRWWRALFTATEQKPDWCQGADSVCHHPACTCVTPQDSRGASKIVCAYHDGCPPDGPACHLCEHLQPGREG